MRKLRISVAGSVCSGKTLTSVYLEKILKEAGFTVTLRPNRDCDQDVKRERINDPLTMESIKLLFSEIEIEIVEVQLSRDALTLDEIRNKEVEGPRFCQ